MWFDSRPSYTSPAVAPAPLGFTFSTQSNPLARPALECSCFIRRLLIKTPSLAHAKQLVELVSAFGDSSPQVNQDSSIQVEFFDCRDCYKALTLMPKFSECKDCEILPLEDKLYGVYYKVDSLISKEELWYEVSKHGDIAWSKSEQLASATNIYYAFFDKRIVAKLLETQIFSSCGHLRAAQTILDHADICRFQAKNSSAESLQGSSPSLSSVSLSSASSFEYTYAYDMGKPKIASPPLSVAQMHTTNEDKAPRAMKIPGHLTPPMQDCRMFQAATNKPPCLSSVVATAPTPAPPASVATATPAAAPAPAGAGASAHASTAAAATATAAAPPEAMGNGNKSNRVDLDLIKYGREKRTTVMLRNIPNKVNLAALRAFLDETNENEYDFLYLRMDFNNKCNVGYAFINFIRPESVATLTQARRGKKWTQYNSFKIIDVSFANIQGRKALIDKFRDSPIMNMDPEYRPKLYYTSGPLTGREERFT